MSERIEIVEQVVELVEIRDPNPPEIIEIVEGGVVENIAIEDGEETVEITEQIIESIETFERGLPGRDGADFEGAVIDGGNF